MATPSMNRPKLRLTSANFYNFGFGSAKICRDNICLPTETYIGSAVTGRPTLDVSTPRGRRL